MNKDKNWCIKCGSEILPKKVDMDYNPTTGKKRYNLLWVCPKKKWYNCHSKFKSDEEGDTYPFEG